MAPHLWCTKSLLHLFLFFVFVCVERPQDSLGNQATGWTVRVADARATQKTFQIGCLLLNTTGGGQIRHNSWLSPPVFPFSALQEAIEGLGHKISFCSPPLHDLVIFSVRNKEQLPPKCPLLLLTTAISYKILISLSLNNYLNPFPCMGGNEPKLHSCTWKIHV